MDSSSSPTQVKLRLFALWVQLLQNQFRHTHTWNRRPSLTWGFKSHSVYRSTSLLGNRRQIKFLLRCQMWPSSWLGVSVSTVGAQTLDVRIRFCSDISVRHLNTLHAIECSHTSVLVWSYEHVKYSCCFFLFVCFLAASLNNQKEKVF